MSAVCQRCKSPTTGTLMLSGSNIDRTTMMLCASCAMTLDAWLRGEEVDTLAQLRARVRWGVLGSLLDVPLGLVSGAAAELCVSVTAQGFAFGFEVDCDPGLTLALAHHRQLPIFAAPTAVEKESWFSAPFFVVLPELVHFKIENTGPRIAPIRNWNLMGIRQDDMPEALKDPAVASFLRRRWPGLRFARSILDDAVDRLEEMTARARANLSPTEKKILDMLEQNQRAKERVERFSAKASSTPAATLDHRSEDEAHQNPGSELACPGFGPGAKGERCCDLAGEPGICGDCHCACHAGKPALGAACPSCGENCLSWATDGEACYRIVGRD